MSALSHLLRPSSAQSDLDALVVRMRQRLYPETIPVLASYWLKTVCRAGHSRGWWKELNELLKEVLREQPLDPFPLEVLREVQNWIEGGVLLTGKTPETATPRMEPFRANLRSEWLRPYIGRLLNEWMSAEVARLLVNENELGVPSDEGLPVLAVGRALERILVRERLSPETLEMFLRPELLSPDGVYPADAEMLRDVVLALLGRTWAPPFPVLPAAVVDVAAESKLPADFRGEVSHASLIQFEGGEEIHVPIAAAEALEIPATAPVRIASILATMDGRWWEAYKLQSSEQQHSIVYRAGGRLTIDYSGEHPKLRVPWPETQIRWFGGVRLPDSFEIFGRKWHASNWERDAEGSWMNLTFSRNLPIAGIQAEADPGFRRSHPASVDMAWTALANAVAASMGKKNRDPIEQLRRGEFIPLGRAILGLAESATNWRLAKREIIETQLKAIRYLQAEISVVYGRVPWGALPATVRSVLNKKRLDPVLVELLNEVFDALPETLSLAAHPDRKGAAGESAPSSSPSRAA